MPTVRPAPSARAAARLREPLLPAPPSTATVGVIPRARYSRTTRAVRAGAPQTSLTDMASSSGMSSGSFATMERRKRIAVPSQGTCSDVAVPGCEVVGDPQRGEGQGYEGGDPVPHHQAEGRLRSDLLDHPDQHPARPGDRVLHLAAAGDDPGDLGPHPGPVADVLVVQLLEARGVEVEPAHPDPHLVGADLRRRVQAPGSLGQHALRLENSVHAHGACGAVIHGPPQCRTQPIHRPDTKILRRHGWPSNDSFRYAG